MSAGRNSRIAVLLLLAAGTVGRAGDPRDIRTGWEIPTESYADQPYVVRTDDGAWLCVLTTGTGHEGAPGQHVVSLRSTDRGRTWSLPVDVEPAGGPEASYAVLLKVPGGRIYAFYNHNTDNLRRVKTDGDGYTTRVDTQGYYVFKYTDDHGRTWSRDRYPIPVRAFEIDRENPYGGAVRFFWNVGKPFVYDGAVCVPLHKVGRFGRSFIARSEGVLLESPNLLTESDPAAITWQTLPDGDVGLRAPAGGGPIAEEQSYCVLSDGSLYCMYRTVDGHPACSTSRDGGHTWSPPEYACYADGRLIKHPRAANFTWKCANGKYLYWFHNHGGRSYDDRNPAWLCGGVEADSPAGRIIHWSQPEIVLYDDDPAVRMSYPDLIEQDTTFYLTETQKTVARIHAVDASLLAGLWGQFEPPGAATDGVALDLPAAGETMPRTASTPVLPTFDASGTGGGLAIDLWVEFADLAAGQILLDSRTETGRGLVLQVVAGGAVEIVLNDGGTESRWACDANVLEAGRRHHVVVNVDAGPRIITFVIDGKLCDGGMQRQFGWGRLAAGLQHANGSTTLRLAPTLHGRVHRLRLYSRPLRTSEAVGNYRVGPNGPRP